MKTGAYWFKFLTEKEQEEFKVNFKHRKPFKIDTFENFEDYLNSNFRDLEEFIKLSFVWVKTIQGTLYWLEISRRKV